MPPPDLWDRVFSPQTLAQECWEWDGSTYRATTYAETFEQASRIACALRQRGVVRGSVVAQIITNGQSSVAGFMGAWMAGATVASLPIMGRGVVLAGYHNQLRRICTSLQPGCVLAEEQFASVLASVGPLGPELLSCEQLSAGDRLKAIDPPQAHETLFIQFSSGTTGPPRGVKLTTQAIAAQMHGLSRRVVTDSDHDVLGSWLPMSHDMGFFGGTLFGWYNAIRGFRSSPERFLGAPWTWLEDCVQFGATISAVPPFALDLAARVQRVRPLVGELRLRHCSVGAEEIYMGPLERAAAAFAPNGLLLQALCPSYGMAEATLAVSMNPPGMTPFALGDTHGTSSSQGVTVPADLVSSGVPLADVAVRIDADSGEIVIAGPSLSTGYFGDAREDGFRADEFWTGDLGLMREGHLFVCGRLDDQLAIGGRNIRTRPIEALIDEHPAVRKGNCAIVSLPGSDSRPRVVLVAEREHGVTLNEAAARALQVMAMEADGLPLDEVVVLERGSFPKTPSGKAQRHRCRELGLEPGATRLRLRST